MPRSSENLRLKNTRLLVKIEWTFRLAKEDGMVPELAHEALANAMMNAQRLMVKYHQDAAAGVHYSARFTEHAVIWTKRWTGETGWASKLSRIDHHFHLVGKDDNAEETRTSPATVSPKKRPQRKAKRPLRVRGPKKDGVEAQV